MLAYTKCGETDHQLRSCVGHTYVIDIDDLWEVYCIRAAVRPRKARHSITAATEWR